MTTEVDDLLTVAEVAAKVRRSQRFVLDELRARRLRGSKYGGAWSIKPADLDVYLESHMNIPKLRRRT